MNYHKLIAIKVSTLHIQDREWILDNLPTQDKNIVVRLLEEFLSLGGGRSSLVASELQLSLYDKPLEEEPEPLKLLSRDIDKRTIEEGEFIKQHLPSQLQQALLTEENWRWLAESANDGKLSSVSTMQENKVASLKLSPKMREHLVNTIHSFNSELLE